MFRFKEELIKIATSVVRHYDRKVKSDIRTTLKKENDQTEVLRCLINDVNDDKIETYVINRQTDLPYVSSGDLSITKIKGISVVKSNQIVSLFDEQVSITDGVETINLSLPHLKGINSKIYDEYEDGIIRRCISNEVFTIVDRDVADYSFTTVKVDNGREYIVWKKKLKDVSNKNEVLCNKVGYLNSSSFSHMFDKDGDLIPANSAIFINNKNELIWQMSFYLDEHTKEEMKALVLSMQNIEILYKTDNIVEEVASEIILSNLNGENLSFNSSIPIEAKFSYQADIPFKRDIRNMNEVTTQNTSDVNDYIFPALMDIDYQILIMQEVMMNGLKHKGVNPKDSN